MTILLGNSAQPSDVKPSEVKESEYDVSLFVSVSKQYWNKWTDDVRAGRDRLVEAVSQYPTAAGVEELMEAEGLFSKMFRVRYIYCLSLNHILLRF